MYELTSPNTVGPADRARYDSARETASAFLERATRALIEIEITRTAGLGPLTFDDRNEIADTAMILARAYSQAAAAWEAYQAGLPLARAYRARATQAYDQAALNRAVAVIAPDEPGHDPLGG